MRKHVLFNLFIETYIYDTSTYDRFNNIKEKIENSEKNNTIMQIWEIN